MQATDPRRSIDNTFEVLKELQVILHVSLASRTPLILKPFEKTVSFFFFSAVQPSIKFSRQ
jgi:hypothetical protein